ncbi:MAG: hypothetical protein O7C58_06525 [Rickettsia endosymbiont of Ixodes persulcatus]|nr:hypothetical protein [Rickettsia endosymbiont of Ixodes persulcatus]
MFLYVFLIMSFLNHNLLRGNESCNNNAPENCIVEPTIIGNYCKKGLWNLEYITPNGKYAILQKRPLKKEWTTVLCKVTRTIKKIYQAESFNGQSISPVPLTVFNQIAWTFVHQDVLKWMTFDVITEKLKQVITDKTIFGPNFITDDFVLGFDENQTQSGSLLRYFSKNSNQQMKVCYKKPKFESSALELSGKNELIKCLFVAGNLLLFDTKKNKYS